SVAVASGAAAELSTRRTSAPGDLDPPDLRTLLQIFPPELPRSLRLELVAKRERVVVVDQDERFARAESFEGSEDRRMLLARRDHPHVQLHPVPCSSSHDGHSPVVSVPAP